MFLTSQRAGLGTSFYLHYSLKLSTYLKIDLVSFSDSSSFTCCTVSSSPAVEASISVLSGFLSSFLSSLSAENFLDSCTRLQVHGREGRLCFKLKPRNKCCTLTRHLTTNPSPSPHHSITFLPPTPPSHSLTQPFSPVCGCYSSRDAARGRRPSGVQPET